MTDVALVVFFLVALTIFFFSTKSAYEKWSEKRKTNDKKG